MKRTIYVLTALLFVVFIDISYAQSIRKNYREMGVMEKVDYNDALQQFWNGGTHSTTGPQVSNPYIADFSLYHFFATQTHTGNVSIHNSLYFLPWHRTFMLDYELRLKSFNHPLIPNKSYDYLSVPYWDWRDEIDYGNLVNTTPISSTTHPDFFMVVIFKVGQE